MDMDQNGTLLATSCTDKCVYIWDIVTNECVAYLYGHSEHISDLKFTHDNKHLITVSYDGCIFVWKLNLQSNNSTTAGINPLSQIKKSLQPNRFTSSGDNQLNDHRLSQANECFTAPIVGAPVPTAASQSYSAIPTRRTGRAVWGPVCNTSFAIMIDNDLDDVGGEDATDLASPIDKVIINNKINGSGSVHSSSSVLTEWSLPVVQFPSPVVEKSLYHVVKLDTQYSEENQAAACNRRLSLEENQQGVLFKAKFPASNLSFHIFF
jgi:WD40 repeat protein